MTDQPTPPRKLTPAVAGHLGGTATLARHGREHFVRAAQLGAAKGGQTTRDRHGSAHFSRIAKLARANDAGRTS